MNQSIGSLHLLLHAIFGVRVVWLVLELFGEERMLGMLREINRFHKRTCMLRVGAQREEWYVMVLEEANGIPEEALLKNRGKTTIWRLGVAMLSLLFWPVQGQAQDVDLFEGEELEETGGVQLESASGNMSTTLADNAGKPGAPTKLKFVRVRGSIFVEAKVQGKPVYFVFDTGASITTLTPAFAKTVGVLPGSSAPRMTTKTANGLREARVGMIHTLTLGGKNLSHVTFTTCPSCGGKLPGRKRPVVGLLGMNVLSRYVVRINDAENTVELQPSIGYNERIADIRPWLATKMQGFLTRSKERDKRAVDLNYQVSIKNRSSRRVTGVVLEVTCYLKGGGELRARSEKVNLSARASKKVVINTPFTRECVDFSSEYLTGRW